MYSTYSSLLNCPCSVSVCIAVCLSILYWCGGKGGEGGGVKQHLLRDDKWGAGPGRTRTRTITNWCALREWHSGGNCGEITIIHDHWPLLLLAIEDVIVCNCIIIIILIYVYVCVLHRMLQRVCDGFCCVRYGQLCFTFSMETIITVIGINKVSFNIFTVNPEELELYENV